MKKIKEQEMWLYRDDVRRLCNCSADKNYLHSENENIINFLLNCLSAIVHKNPDMHKHICPTNLAKAKTIMSPFKQEFLDMTRANRRGEVIHQIKTQKGGGFLLSGLLAAAIPLISTLIEKILKKK